MFCVQLKLRREVLIKSTYIKFDVLFGWSPVSIFCFSLMMQLVLCVWGGGRGYDVTILTVSLLKKFHDRNQRTHGSYKYDVRVTFLILSKIHIGSCANRLIHTSHEILTGRRIRLSVP